MEKTTTADTYRRLLQDHLYADLKIKVKGKAVLCHKFVVCVRCPSLFSQPLLETASRHASPQVISKKPSSIKPAKVYIPPTLRVTVKEVTKLVEFIYTGDTLLPAFFDPEALQDVIALHALASHYSMDELSFRCRKWVRDRLNFENLPKILKTAMREKEPIITEVALRFMQCHFAAISANKALKKQIGSEIFKEQAQKNKSLPAGEVIELYDEQAPQDLYLSDLRQIHDKMPFADVRYNYGFEFVTAHRAILSVASPRCCASLINKVVPAIGLPPPCDSKEPEHLRQVLRFLYYGEDSIDVSQFTEIKRFGIELGLTKFVNLCETKARTTQCPIVLSPKAHRPLSIGGSLTELSAFKPTPSMTGKGMYSVSQNDMQEAVLAEAVLPSEETFFIYESPLPSPSSSAFPSNNASFVHFQSSPSDSYTPDMPFQQEDDEDDESFEEFSMTIRPRDRSNSCSASPFRPAEPPKTIQPSLVVGRERSNSYSTEYSDAGTIGRVFGNHLPPGAFGDQTIRGPSTSRDLPRFRLSTPVQNLSHSSPSVSIPTPVFPVFSPSYQVHDPLLLKYGPTSNIPPDQSSSSSSSSSAPMGSFSNAVHHQRTPLMPPGNQGQYTSLPSLTTCFPPLPAISNRSNLTTSTPPSPNPPTFQPPIFPSTVNLMKPLPLDRQK